MLYETEKRPLLSVAPKFDDLTDKYMAQLRIHNLRMTKEQFLLISDMVKELCGINLHDGKKELVKARLGKRLRALGIASYDQYIEHLRTDATGNELTLMLDAISTNLTSFFREGDHFRHLCETLLPAAIRRAKDGKRRLRVWSAGCSTGEEPYTIAMCLRDTIPDIDFWDVRILATDLSTRVLQHAERGVYGHEKVSSVPPRYRNRYFVRSHDHREKLYQVTDSLRSMIHFSRLNLMEHWPMSGPFDAIFCRNVMIYFDKPTQERLVSRMFDLLPPGGTLFIGHSESLSGVKHSFQYVMPAVYKRP